MYSCMFLNSDNTSDIKYICFLGTVIDGAAYTYNLPSLVLDGDIDYQSDITTVSMQFAGFTSHLHGVMAYEWSVGMTPGGEEVMPFTTHGIMHKEERNVTGDGKCVLCLPPPPTSRFMRAIIFTHPTFDSDE